MKRIRTLLFATAAISLAVGYCLRLLFPGSSIDERAFLKQIAPGLAFSEKKVSPPHYATTDNFTAFNSYDLVPSVRGYAGPIKAMVVLSPDGRIVGVRIMEHNETKNYVRYMESPDYLDRFTGKSITDQFQVDKDLDGISRATVSVEALAKTVRESSRIIGSEVLGIRTAVEGRGLVFGLEWLWYMLLFSTAVSFYFMSRKSKKFLRARDVFLMVSIPLTGLYLSSPFSVLQVFNAVLMRPSSSTLWYAVIISTFFSLMIAGRFYCGWLCPFGTLSEFIGRLPFRKWELPAETDYKWRRLKYVLLAAATAVVFISGRVEFGNYETYVTLFSFHGNIPAWTLVALTLAANIRIERFWCRYLCPVAALTGILTREAKGYPGAPTCPIGIKEGPFISECIRCNKCYRKPAGSE